MRKKISLSRCKALEFLESRHLLSASVNVENKDVEIPFIPHYIVDCLLKPVLAAIGSVAEDNAFVMGESLHEPDGTFTLNEGWLTSAGIAALAEVEEMDETMTFSQIGKHMGSKEFLISAGFGTIGLFFAQLASSETSVSRDEKIGSLIIKTTDKPINLKFMGFTLLGTIIAQGPYLAEVVSQNFPLTGEQVSLLAGETLCLASMVLFYNRAHEQGTKLTLISSPKQNGIIEAATYTFAFDIAYAINYSSARISQLVYHYFQNQVKNNFQVFSNSDSTIDGLNANHYTTLLIDLKNNRLNLLQGITLTEAEVLSSYEGSLKDIQVYYPKELPFALKEIGNFIHATLVYEGTISSFYRPSLGKELYRMNYMRAIPFHIVGGIIETQLEIAANWIERKETI